MDDDLIALVVSDASEHMTKAVEHTQAEFSAIRTGRATPALVEHLKVDYYGTETELRQMAGFSVPEARLLVVSPYDKSSLGAIEKALQGSDLGITPSNDGTVIRLSFPIPTEQRRKELVKVVKQKAEEGRVTVRNMRRNARQELEAHAEGRRAVYGRARAGREGARQAHTGQRGGHRPPARPQGAGAPRDLTAAGRASGDDTGRHRSGTTGAGP